MMSAMAKHGKPEEPKDSPAYMFKLIGSIGLILLGGLFAGESTMTMERRVRNKSDSTPFFAPRFDVGIDGLGRHATTCPRDVFGRSQGKETRSKCAEAVEARKTLGSRRKSRLFTMLFMADSVLRSCFSGMS
jgi:hypothetical protein